MTPSECGPTLENKACSRVRRNNVKRWGYIVRLRGAELLVIRNALWPYPRCFPHSRPLGGHLRVLGLRDRSLPRRGKSSGGFAAAQKGQGRAKPRLAKWPRCFGRASDTNPFRNFRKFFSQKARSEILSITSRSHNFTCNFCNRPESVVRGDLHFSRVGHQPHCICQWATKFFQQELMREGGGAITR